MGGFRLAHLPNQGDDMNWFRFYHAALDDPKVQLLEPVLFKAWVNLLCLASQSEPRGALPGINAIAFRLRTDADTAADICMRLEQQGLLDGDYGHVVVHDWEAWQRTSDDVNARVRKHRSGPTGSVNLPVKRGVTLHETEEKRYGNGLEQNRTDTDTEQRRTEREGANAPKSQPTPLRSVPKPHAQTVPDDFMVTDDMRRQAEGYGVPSAEIDRETEKFRDHFKAHGKKMTDWPAAWRNWMRRVSEFAPQKANGRYPTKLSQAEATRDRLLRIAKGESP